MSYLTDAAEAFAAAGDPKYLWRPVPRIYESSPILGPLERVGDAGNRRLRALRSCVIFCALALEAYANGFIAENLTAEQIEEIDREKTIRKLTKGPKIAGLEASVDPGGVLANEIGQLFRTRDLFVHSRRDEHGAYLQYLTDRDEELFGPPVIGRYIVIVAQVIVDMEKLCTPPSLAGQAVLINAHPEVIDELVQQIGSKIMSPVREDAGSPISPIEMAQRRAIELREHFTS